MREKNPRRRNGFSLIEVLISLALTFISLVGAAELLVHSLRAEAKAESTAEMTRAAAERLEKSKSSISSGGTMRPEPGTPREDGVLPFAVESRRGNLYLGRWIPLEKAEKTPLDWWAFEIFSELEPDAALEFVVLYSKELGF